MKKLIQNEEMKATKKRDHGLPKKAAFGKKKNTLQSQHMELVQMGAIGQNKV